MSKAKGGFFDDDDDEDQGDTFQESFESYDTSNLGGARGGAAGGAAGDDSLSSSGLPSPNRYQTTNDNGAGRPGRASSVGTGRAAAGNSSTRAYESTRGGSPAMNLDDLMGQEAEISTERNVQRLLRAWHNEMGAPELLTFPRELVDNLVWDLTRRVSCIQSYRYGRARADPFRSRQTETHCEKRSKAIGRRRIILHECFYRRDGEHASSSRPQDVHPRTDIQGESLRAISQRNAELMFEFLRDVARTMRRILLIATGRR